jgi:hypothetical protein
MTANPLPSPERERANAAYAWVKECQAQLANALKSQNAGFPEQWAQIEWHYGRLDQAVSLMADAERAAGGAS